MTNDFRSHDGLECPLQSAGKHSNCSSSAVLKSVVATISPPSAPSPPARNLASSRRPAGELLAADHRCDGCSSWMSLAAPCRGPVCHRRRAAVVRTPSAPPPPRRRITIVELLSAPCGLIHACRSLLSVPWQVMSSWPLHGLLPATAMQRAWWRPWPLTPQLTALWSRP